ncbi:MAG: ATP-binding protein [Microcoleus sp. PH2017_29_MFU_D_A]|uniref:AAA family ATPase n=1 Tax=unclassified Microcoleus TaxID=2642155 RepID=UPI001DEF7B0A|nr:MULTISPECIES: ATP-binding protein [unclassified Microcoleus]TAE09317.1 MAG: ATP-binding protein [Oscillatoriales cyanobacterium]MCC3592920.1 ATP-binding protein [Microcoleus sp. PH2017_28_MFU_U_A]MCC3606275.1 ATP-binding protein [Microcoleus sp. PH2017_29_MFU_D_A]MCC3637356.1 ATP-binding protein [Microcoleus sp. PH2017_37_MFU_D_B]TAE20521.1 MAG: ATP-binding protein [Oscillatoriales cyanobacterium]
MLIDFSVTNFRSIKEEQTLSAIADSSNRKNENTFVPIEGNKLRLLNSAAIYGANASGKSNILKALHRLISYIQTLNIDVDHKIPYYEPFKLDESRLSQPSIFKLSFILEGIMYDYQIAFDSREVHHEQLDFYPKKRKSNLFIRTKNEVKRGDYFQDKRSFSNKALTKYPYLSKVAREEHEQMQKIYEYLKTYAFFPAYDNQTKKSLIRHVNQLLQGDEKLKKKLSKLIQIADTHIDRINIEEKSITYEFDEEMPEDLKTLIMSDKYEVFAVHKTFKNNVFTGESEFSFFHEESIGTMTLYTIGTLILFILNEGHILVIDELDNSLHPKLCKFLIKLFHHPSTNPRNAQLIFASHETTLLDRELLRKDQIWFAEKNKYGETQLFSAQDFDKVKGDEPFDQWYMQGKFGGQPNIKEVEFMFGDE